MTISKERLNEIVTASWYADDGLSSGDLDSLLDFALAIIRRVEAECGVTTTINGFQHVIKLPIVSEE